MFVPKKAKPLYEDVAGRVLGAARSVSLITEILALTAEEIPGASGRDVLAGVREAGLYFRRTRGAETASVANAVGILLDSLRPEADLPLAQARARMAQRCRAYRQESAGAVRAAAEVGADRLRGAHRLFLYDYSSSVAATVRRLGELGTRVILVIPESRVLDGGRPYVEELADTPHAMELIPDCALAAGMDGCDAVLEGAESLQADGGFVNTIGTLGVAILARHFGVPVLVSTTLLKIDPATLSGALQQIHPRDVSAQLTAGWPPELIARVSIPCPNLERVPAELVSCYCTEEGALLPGEIRALAERFHAQLEALQEG